MEAASGCCGQLGIGGPKVRGECFASLALPFEIRTCFFVAITFRGGSGSGGAGAGGAGRGGTGWGGAGGGLLESSSSSSSGGNSSFSSEQQRRAAAQHERSE